jgi:anti-anti-sigma factor
MLTAERDQRTTVGRMSLAIEESHDRAVVRVGGVVGSSEAAELDLRLSLLITRRPARVVFDLDGLRLIGSLGLGVLLAFRRGLIRRGGRVALARARPEVAALLAQVGLDKMFETFEGPPDVPSI